MRIGFLGGPSSGKSTTAASLFGHLKTVGYKAELIDEYARFHINAYGPPTSILTQYLFYEKQLTKESVIPAEVDYVITDSPVILSYVYGVLYSDITNLDHKLMLSNLYEKLLNNGFLRYDLLFFLQSTRPYIKDGTRTQSEQEAKQIGEFTRNLLDMHRVKYINVEEPDILKRINFILPLLGISSETSSTVSNSK